MLQKFLILFLLTTLGIVHSIEMKGTDGISVKASTTVKHPDLPTLLKKNSFNEILMDLSSVHTNEQTVTDSHSVTTTSDSPQASPHGQITTVAAAATNIVAPVEQTLLGSRLNNSELTFPSAENWLQPTIMTSRESQTQVTTSTQPPALKSILTSPTTLKMFKVPTNPSTHDSQTAQAAAVVYQKPTHNTPLYASMSDSEQVTSTTQTIVYKTSSTDTDLQQAIIAMIEKDKKGTNRQCQDDRNNFLKNARTINDLNRIHDFINGGRSKENEEYLKNNYNHIFDKLAQYRQVELHRINKVRNAHTKNSSKSRSDTNQVISTTQTIAQELSSTDTDLQQAIIAMIEKDKKGANRQCQDDRNNFLKSAQNINDLNSIYDYINCIKKHQLKQHLQAKYPNVYPQLNLARKNERNRLSKIKKKQDYYDNKEDNPDYFDPFEPQSQQFSVATAPTTSGASASSYFSHAASSSSQSRSLTVTHPAAALSAIALNSSQAPSLRRLRPDEVGAAIIATHKRKSQNDNNDNSDYELLSDASSDDGVEYDSTNKQSKKWELS